uniref:Glycine zipper domain-containing protein n=1 Tax=Tetradesmus obliquus TaxID=3088 RepID=A0A383W5I2_TETOB|eukprot:jgi/Sobl393_1/7214/SZX71916.1
MSESQQGPVPMEGGERASADNGAGVASKAKTAGALTGAAAGAVGLGAVTGGLGAAAGAAAGALLGTAVGQITAAEATSEAGRVEAVVLPAPGDDAAAAGGDAQAANVQIPGLPGVQETRE